MEEIRVLQNDGSYKTLYRKQGVLCNKDGKPLNVQNTKKRRTNTRRPSAENK